MSAPFTIVIPGAPMGKQRARSGRNGFYTPAKTVSYETHARWVAKHEMRGRAPFAGPVNMEIRAHFPIPTSWPIAKRQAALTGEILPITKPDRDNIEKMVADSLNGIVYLDDKQIVDGRTSKVYGPNPMVVVTVKEITCGFVERTAELETLNSGASNGRAEDRA